MRIAFPGTLSRILMTDTNMIHTCFSVSDFIHTGEEQKRDALLLDIISHTESFLNNASVHH